MLRTVKVDIHSVGFKQFKGECVFLSKLPKTLRDSLICFDIY